MAAVAVAQKKIPKRELAVAAVPFFFAIQQFLEGIVWLYLHTPGPIQAVGVYGFSFFAFLFWPVYIPLAMMHAEHNSTRKKLMTYMLLAGVVASVFFLYQMLTRGIAVELRQQCLDYKMSMQPVIGLLYWLGVSGAPFFSSNPWWVLSGIGVTLGVLLAGLVYPFAITSTWCYFAAIASLIIAIYCYMKHPRR